MPPRDLRRDGLRLHPRAQSKEWSTLEALHADRTGEQVLTDLKPVNPDFEPIVLTGEEGEVQVVAELLQVLDGG